jgi:hypothetical protein
LKRESHRWRTLTWGRAGRHRARPILLAAFGIPQLIGKIDPDLHHFKQQGLIPRVLRFLRKPQTFESVPVIVFMLVHRGGPQHEPVITGWGRRGSRKNQRTVKKGASNKLLTKNAGTIFFLMMTDHQSQLLHAQKSGLSAVGRCALLSE